MTIKTYEIRGILNSAIEGECRAQLWRVDEDQSEAHVANIEIVGVGTEMRVEYTDENQTARKVIFDMIDPFTGTPETVVKSEHLKDFYDWTVAHWNEVREGYRVGEFPSELDMIEELIMQKRSELENDEARIKLRNHREKNFAVSVESISQDEAIFDDEKRVNLTYNGRQNHPFTVNEKEAKELIAKLKEAFYL
jgi:hypothetical protein